MDDGDLSMDSFVDIVANTVGMVIILTMLTIARVDERGRQVDDDFRTKMQELGKSKANLGKVAGSILGSSRSLVVSGTDLGVKGLDVENMDSEARLAQATALLKRIDEIKAQNERYANDLKLATSRRDDVQASHAKVKQKLSALRARKKTLTTAMRVRKTVEAQLVTDVPGLNMGEFERTPLTSLKQEVTQLETRIKSMEEEAKIGRDEFNRLQKEVEDLRKQQAALAEELERYREVAGLEIAIASPRPLREQAKMPVFFECYSRPAAEEGGPDEVRVRLLGSAASPDGELYRSVADATSQFRTFLAGQTDEFKGSHRLHFIVRPDAGAAFRKARDVARSEGWTVGWNPVEKGVDLNIGAVPSATTTARVSARAVATPR